MKKTESYPRLSVVLHCSPKDATFGCGRGDRGLMKQPHQGNQYPEIEGNNHNEIQGEAIHHTF